MTDGRLSEVLFKGSECFAAGIVSRILCPFEDVRVQ